MARLLYYDNAAVFCYMGETDERKIAENNK